MKFRLLFALVLMGLSSAAVAGPFNDKLAICLVKSTTDADKNTLMRWIFAAMATHPSVKDLGKVSPEAGARLNKEVAQLFWSLVSDRCGAETKDAVKFEGPETIGSSFEVLGKVAMQGLMADADVARYMGGVDANLDKAEMEAFFRDAAK